MKIKEEYKIKYVFTVFIMRFQTLNNNSLIGCPERRKIIEALRKEGDFLYNTDDILNNEGGKILCRRPQKMKPRIDSHYKPCPNCKGYVSKLTLRYHYRKCSGTKKGVRDIMIRSRRLAGDIHRKASKKLRNEVFPVLRDNEVANSIRYDELVIVFGNWLCAKLRKEHQQKMIRNKLRLLGRFLISIKSLDPTIKELADVLHPSQFENVIEAVNQVARLQEGSGQYASPWTARDMGDILNKIARRYNSECIKNGQKDKCEAIQDFLVLMKEDFTTTVYTMVKESTLERKKQKDVLLPSTEDVKQLMTYLTDERQKCYKKIEEEGFSFKTWKDLASYTLIFMQVFNRRRPGEMERVLITDYQLYRGIDEESDAETLKHFPLQTKQRAKQYVRFLIRGKLVRGVPVLLHKDIVQCVELILKYRSNAGVPDTNPYVFGIPGKTAFTHLEATSLIRKYSAACGAKHHGRLRGTKLRQHIATHSALYNLQGEQIEDLATFLGHETKIHKDHYRLPIATRDITQMSHLLEKAQGGYAACV